MGRVRITVAPCGTGQWELSVEGLALVLSSNRQVLVGYAKTLCDTLCTDGRTIEVHVQGDGGNAAGFRTRRGSEHTLQ